MSKCDHDLAVRQDPNSGAHELLFCTKGCGLEPKRRVSAAESIRRQSEEQLDAARAQLSTHDQLIAAAYKTIHAMDERIKNLEAMQPPFAGGAG